MSEARKRENPTLVDIHLLSIPHRGFRVNDLVLSWRVWSFAGGVVLASGQDKGIPKLQLCKIRLRGRETELQIGDRNLATTYSPTTSAVPLALAGLTAVFGKGTGVTPPP